MVEVNNVKFEIIPNWSKKNLRCHFCGETRSVKYKTTIVNPVVSNKPTEVCVCNACAWKFTTNIMEEPK